MDLSENAGVLTLAPNSYISAPMVEYSTLAFRKLVKSYGVHLTYTAMLHSRHFHESDKYRQSNLSLCSEEECVVQFNGQFGEDIVKAAFALKSFYPMAEKCVKSVDINFGCPQGIAKRGNYGAYLLEQEEKTLTLVKNCAIGLQGVFPLACKIRKLAKDDLQKTINMALAMEAAGCQMLAIHGRTKEQKGQDTGQCDWDAIRRVKSRLRIPVIGNGGVETKQDADNLLAATGCDGVMSAEALLENPALFYPSEVPGTEMLQKYFGYLGENNLDTSLSAARGFILKAFYSHLHEDLESMNLILGCSSYFDLQKKVAIVGGQKSFGAPLKKLVWYNRHRKTSPSVNILRKESEECDDLAINLMFI